MNEETNELSCANGQECIEEVLCTPETCPYGQKDGVHGVNCIRHICAHDFDSGPYVNTLLGASASCACGMTEVLHEIMGDGP